MFSWQDVPSVINARKCMAHIRKKLLTPENYGFGAGKWNLTELIKDRDPRVPICRLILDGRSSTSEREPGGEFVGVDGNAFRFKLQVLTRQACRFDKNGNRIWNNAHGKDSIGSAEDIVVTSDDAPVQGDVVVFKDCVLREDSDGEPIKSPTIISLMNDHKSVHKLRKFTVDSNLCISVPNPYALMALEHNGYRGPKPEFEKEFRQRKITNWWFKEVPHDFGKEVPIGGERKTK